MRLRRERGRLTELFPLPSCYHELSRSSKDAFIPPRSGLHSRSIASWIRSLHVTVLHNRSPWTTARSCIQGDGSLGLRERRASGLHQARASVESGYIESFNGRLPDERLNVEVFFTLPDAGSKLALWLDDYNHHRPHSALADQTPAEFAAAGSSGNDGDTTALENAPRFPAFPPHGYDWNQSTNRPLLNPVV